MSEARIAIRYAKPLMQLADEKGKIDVVKKDLDAFLNLCRTERAFSLFLKNPIINNFKKREILNKIFTKKVDPLTLSLIDIMARKSREFVLEDMAIEFMKLYDLKMGIQKATVVSPVALDSSLKKEFAKIVEKISGMKAEMSEEVDEALIGGFTLRVGDQMIDDSVRGKLDELKYKLIKQ